MDAVIEMERLAGALPMRTLPGKRIPVNPSPPDAWASPAESRDPPASIVFCKNFFRCMVLVLLL
jgi:hypothetical protein